MYTLEEHKNLSWETNSDVKKSRISIMLISNFEIEGVSKNLHRGVRNYKTKV